MASGSITAYGNDVLQFNGFKCVDSPKFCGKTQLSTLQTELDALTKKVEGLQAWGRCITAKGSASASSKWWHPLPQPRPARFRSTHHRRPLQARGPTALAALCQQTISARLGSAT